MPSELVGELTAPLRQLQAMVGTGTTDAAASLAAVQHALADIAAATDRSWEDTRWTGDAAAAAADFTAETVETVEALAERASRLGATTSAATAAVARARERLQRIVDDFEARATALESRLDDPGVADELIEEARRALDEATDVVDDLRVELDGHRATVIPPAAAGALLSRGGSSPTLAGAFHPSPNAVRLAGQEVLPTVDPGVFGEGLGIRLPDGGMATAPNAVAASAVRYAMTQLGVPYDWGGTTPGVGLDCSGLTQWAYHEAGLDLPRLAQEQDVGVAIDPSAVRPGDLAVWDGHVAMIVGDGVMIEAGDPVHLSPIRTTNDGQGFQGFWRPTA